MTLIRWSTMLACTAILTLAGAQLQAQTTRPAPQTPVPPQSGVQPQIDRPAEPVEQETPDRVRYPRPIIRVAQSYTLRAGDVVREVRSVFGDVAIEGLVEGDVLVIMGSARLAGTADVRGSLVVVGGSATIDEGASIDRDLVIVGGTLNAPVGFSPDGEHVVVGTPWLGATLDRIVPWITRGLIWGRLIVPELGWVWGFVLIFFLIYFALNTVFDRPVAASADVLAARPFSAFFTGLLLLLLSVPVLTIVAASVIGLAIVPILLCALIAAGLVGKAAVLRAIGRGVVRAEPPEGRIAAFAAFLIGFVLLTLAYLVPVLGFAAWALTSVLGLGAAAITFRAAWRSERPARVAVPAPAAAAAASVAPVAPPVFVAEADHAAPPLGVPLSAPAASATVNVPPAPPVYTSGLAQYPRATFFDRVAAFALDCLLVAIANELLDMSRYEGFFLLLLLAYHIAFWAWKGTTLGGIIIGLRVIRTHGADLRFADALVRGLSGVFSLAALGIGCFWMLQDPERQMWHDKIAGTLVVKVPREMVMRD